MTNTAITHQIRPHTSIRKEERRQEIRRLRRYVGWYLHHIRTDNGVSLEALAQLSGYRPATIKRIENGKEIMDWPTVATLCLILDHPPGDHLWDGG